MGCSTRALPPGACARSALLLGLTACAMRAAWATGKENRPQMPALEATDHQRPRARLLVAEMGSGNFNQTSTPCDVDVVGRGNTAACFEHNVPSAGVADYPLDAPEVKIPTDGSPWGVHVAPAKAEGSYIITWYEGTAVVGPDSARVPDTSREAGSCQVFAQDGEEGAERVEHSTVESGVSVYRRQYFTAYGGPAHSYLSPRIHHATVEGLTGGQRYVYRVSTTGGSSRELSFVAMPQSGRDGVYPFHLGLMGDVGQTYNSTTTMLRMLDHNLHAILNMGDLSYADQYTNDDAQHPHVCLEEPCLEPSSNQRRWDSFARLWEPAMAAVPTLHAPGNHELETDGIAASITPQTQSGFGFPHNYPFQAFASRYPAPGQTAAGHIDSNLYYSTDTGPAHVAVLNNYVPFHRGSAQYDWFLADMRDVNRDRTPWVVVIVHAPPYHTYFHHYKEMECFLDQLEEEFFAFGVDLVLSGHIHAFERTHGMYKYELNTCGPAYVAVGDGGNVEGVYRNFVDEVDPSLGKYFCERSYTQRFNNTTPEVPDFLAGYQRAPHPLGCRTVSLERSYIDRNNVPRSTPMGLGEIHPELPDHYWCQVAQPLWSAHRDPSFGFATLVIESAHVARLKWFRNADAADEVADETTYERLASCPNARNLNPTTQALLVMDDASSGPKRDASVVAAEVVGALLLAGVCSAALYLGLRHCTRMGWVSLREGKLCCCQVHPVIRRLMGMPMGPPGDAPQSSLDDHAARRFARFGEEEQETRYVQGDGSAMHGFVATPPPVSNPFASTAVPGPFAFAAAASGPGGGGGSGGRVGNNPLFDAPAPVAATGVEGGAAGSVELSGVAPAPHDDARPPAHEPGFMLQQ